MEVTDLSPVSLVSVAIMVLAPLLVALLTKASWPAWVRSVVLLLISGLVGIGNAFIGNPDGWKPGVVVVNAVIAFVIGVASYFGLWKSTGVPEKLKGTGVSDPSTGAGQSPGSIDGSTPEPVNLPAPIGVSADALIAEMRSDNPAVAQAAEAAVRNFLAQVGVQ